MTPPDAKALVGAILGLAEPVTDQETILVLRAHLSNIHARATRLGELLAERDAAREQLEAALTAIRDYEPDEVAKGEFAYDRMVENYRDAARNGLAAARGGAS